MGNPSVTGIFHFRAKICLTQQTATFAVLTCVSAGNCVAREYLQTLQFIVAIAGNSNCNSDAAVWGLASGTNRPATLGDRV